jgi:hypothetical protein
MARLFAVCLPLTTDRGIGEAQIQPPLINVH